MTGSVADPDSSTACPAAWWARATRSVSEPVSPLGIKAAGGSRSPGTAVRSDCSTAALVAGVRRRAVLAGARLRVVAGLPAPRDPLALAAFRRLGAAVTLERGRGGFLGADLAVVSSCWTFSRSLLTVLLTLRRFRRTSLSVVSRSLRTSRGPLLTSLRRSSSASCAACTERAACPARPPRPPGHERPRCAPAQSRSLSQPSRPASVSRPLTLEPQSEPMLRFAQPTPQTRAPASLRDEAPTATNNQRHGQLAGRFRNPAAVTFVGVADCDKALPERRGPPNLRARTAVSRPRRPCWSSARAGILG